MRRLQLARPLNGGDGGRDAERTTMLQRPNTGTPWTKKDDQKLERLLRSGMFAREIAIELLRSRMSVYHRMHRLGLSSNRTWSQLDLDYLRDHYGQVHVETIARALRRTSGAIHAKAFDLKLTTPPKPWTPEQDTRLRAMIAEGILTFREIGSELNRTEIAIVGRVAVLGIRRYKQCPRWTLEQQEELRDRALQGESATDIGRAIGRSASAVYSKASQMKISFRKIKERIDG